MTSINIVELDKSFLKFFFYFRWDTWFWRSLGAGAAGIRPPPLGTKLAQTPVGARVHEFSFTAEFMYRAVHCFADRLHSHK